VEEVGWGSDGGQGWGAVGIEMQGETITTRTGVVLDIVGTIEVVLYDLVGGGDIDLVNIVNL
jgi:hypothetical protein